MFVGDTRFRFPSPNLWLIERFDGFRAGNIHRFEDSEVVELNGLETSFVVGLVMCLDEDGCQAGSPGLTDSPLYS